MSAAFRKAGTAALAVALILPCPALAIAQDGQNQEDQQAKKATRAPLEFRKLRDWLPAEVGGLKRKEARGGRMGSGTEQVTHAEGDYGDEQGEKTAHISVIDYSASVEQGNSLAYWKDMEIDNESDTGYQRTTKIEEYPAMMTFDSQAKSGTIIAVIDDRVMVNISMNGLDDEAFKKVQSSLGLKKLGELVKAGAGPSTRPAQGGQPGGGDSEGGGQ